MECLVIVVIVAVLAGPILGIMALIAVRRLNGQSQNQLIAQLTSRIFLLEKTVSELEKAVRQASPAERKTETTERVTGPDTESPQASAPPPVPEFSQRTTSPVIGPSTTVPVFGTSDEQKSAGQDMETVIAGRWFNRIGIVALLIAISYFLKLAFDNNWIGPSGRVAIGVLFGALMLPWSQWLLGRGYTYFSEGIAALGEATLFLSVWAGCQYYALYSRDVGFVAMIAITAAMTVVAIGRNSQRIAVLSLLGGLLTRISSTGSMIPAPKKWAQMRLATLVAKNGFCAEVSHCPRISRRSFPDGIVGAAPPKNFGAITRPPTGCFTSPPPRS